MFEAAAAVVLAAYTLPNLTGPDFGVWAVILAVVSVVAVFSLSAWAKNHVERRHNAQQEKKAKLLEDRKRWEKRVWEDSLLSELAEALDD